MMLPTGERMARFGVLKTTSTKYAFTAESLLLSQIPVNCPPLDIVQADVEKLYSLRDNQGEPAWSSLLKAQESALQATVDSRRLFRQYLTADSLKAGNDQLDDLELLLGLLLAPLQREDREGALTLQTQIMRALVYLGNELAGDFPYTVSKAVYNEGLPRLLGRATAELTVTSRKYGDVVLTAMLDGYSAPITAGNFADLAQRKFYDGLPLGEGRRMPLTADANRTFLSSGQPTLLGNTNVSGFIDPRTGRYRTLPVEILPDGASEPLYRPENMGGVPALPFRAKGSIGMVHSLGNPDDGSSEFFILLNDVQPGSKLQTQARRRADAAAQP